DKDAGSGLGLDGVGLVVTLSGAHATSADRELISARRPVRAPRMRNQFLCSEPRRLDQPMSFVPRLRCGCTGYTLDASRTPSSSDDMFAVERLPASTGPAVPARPVGGPYPQPSHAAALEARASPSTRASAPSVRPAHSSRSETKRKSRSRTVLRPALRALSMARSQRRRR